MLAIPANTEALSGKLRMESKVQSSPSQARSADGQQGALKTEPQFLRNLIFLSGILLMLGSGLFGKANAAHWDMLAVNIGNKLPTWQPFQPARRMHGDVAGASPLKTLQRIKPPL